MSSLFALVARHRTATDWDIEINRKYKINWEDKVDWKDKPWNLDTHESWSASTTSKSRESTVASFFKIWQALANFAHLENWIKGQDWSSTALFSTTALGIPFTAISGTFGQAMSQSDQSDEQNSDLLEISKTNVLFVCMCLSNDL